MLDFAVFESGGGGGGGGGLDHHQQYHYLHRVSVLFPLDPIIASEYGV